MFVNEVIINRIKKRKGIWKKFLKKWEIDKTPDIIYAVAFNKKVINEKNANKAINHFMKKFQEYRVYLVSSKNKVKCKK